MSPVELQVLLSALILRYKIKKKMSKEIQLHEWNTQPLLPDKAITRVKGQTCKKLLLIKLLGSFSLIQRKVGICSVYSYVVIAQQILEAILGSVESCSKHSLVVLLTLDFGQLFQKNWRIGSWCLMLKSTIILGAGDRYYCSDKPSLGSCSCFT